MVEGCSHKKCEGSMSITEVAGKVTSLHIYCPEGSLMKSPIDGHSRCPLARTTAKEIESRNND